MGKIFPIIKKGGGAISLGPDFGGPAPHHPQAGVGISLLRVDPSSKQIGVAAALSGDALLEGMATGAAGAIALQSLAPQGAIQAEAGVGLGRVDPTIRAHTVGASISGAAAIEGLGMTAQGALGLDELDLAGGVQAGAAIDLFRVDPSVRSLNVEAALSGAISLDELETGAQAGVALTALEPAGEAGVGSGIALAKIANDYGSGMQVAGDWQATAALELKVSPIFVPTDDTYADEGAAGSNFGTNANVNIRDDNIFGSDMEIGYLLFDLRAFAGFTSVDGADFTFTAGVNNGDSGTLSWQFHAFDAQPFDENTLTWNNQPSTNLQFTETVAVSGGSLTEYTVPISAADLNLLLGKWAMLRGTSSIRNRTSVSSKDEADTAQHPHLENMTLEPA